MKFSSIVRTREVDLLAELVLFVTEIPSSCPWPSFKPSPGFTVNFSSLLLYSERKAAILPMAEYISDELMVAKDFALLKVVKATISTSMKYASNGTHLRAYNINYQQQKRNLTYVFTELHLDMCYLVT